MTKQATKLRLRRSDIHVNQSPKGIVRQEGHGITRDERGQEQPKDKKRAQR